MVRRPTEDDRVEVIRRLLSGLEDGADAHELAAALAGLHPKNNTFPGEVFMELAADALDLAGINRDAAILYEGLIEAHLPECQFRGRENRKIQYAILTSAALRAGLEPDLLDEVMWWHTDDYWRYAFVRRRGVDSSRRCTTRHPDNTTRPAARTTSRRRSPAMSHRTMSCVLRVCPSQWGRCGTGR